jgi:hypothetical protein
LKDVKGQGNLFDIEEANLKKQGEKKVFYYLPRHPLQGEVSSNIHNGRLRFKNRKCGPDTLT